MSDQQKLGRQPVEDELPDPPEGWHFDKYQTSREGRGGEFYRWERDDGEDAVGIKEATQGASAQMADSYYRTGADDTRFGRANKPFEAALETVMDYMERYE